MRGTLLLITVFTVASCAALQEDAHPAASATISDVQRPITSVAAVDFRTVALGHSDGDMTVWNLDQKKPILRWKAASGAIHSVAVEREGERVAIAGEDVSTTVWNLRTGTVIQLDGLTDIYRCVAALPGGRFIVGGDAGEIRLISEATGASSILRVKGSAIYRIAVHQQGRTAASAGEGATELWDMESHMKVGNVQGVPDGVDAMTFLRDDLAIGCITGEIVVVDSFGAPYARWGSGREYVVEMAISEDQRFVAVGRSKGGIEVREVLTGLPVMTWGREKDLSAVAFLPKAWRLVAGYEDGHLLECNVLTALASCTRSSTCGLSWEKLSAILGQEDPSKAYAGALGECCAEACSGQSKLVASLVPD